jgi:hypothetical protein
MPRLIYMCKKGNFGEEEGQKGILTLEIVVLRGWIDYVGAPALSLTGQVRNEQEGYLLAVALMASFFLTHN